ncbi:L-seryl-tRNA(Sec) selenium transferase [Halalkalibacter oceani]|uniref:L-seryl-tRNA(Sec) selenium transferase n=1 Tax=Halalkalibacter oceani TaxID=1653776 RepID=A0A9X2ING9_9BACI|nr:L-seryl-tRNA(Sec) selenium transferase [Halalkalibacter oceani]
MKHLARQLPAIHELQKHQRFEEIMGAYHLTSQQLTAMLKHVVASVREQLLAGDDEISLAPGNIDGELFHQLEAYARKEASVKLQHVINGTGTVLHTNLGRARLSGQAQKKVIEAASSYTNLEYQLHSGKRGSRHDLIEAALREVTGAEAAIVVNNNAAAVYFVLSALARGKEVIVSRGELVEIGGSFRVSSIMEESGAVLKEVGTTNKTHLYDYEQAITAETALLMKVHTSNFKMIGFTEAVPAKELKPLADANNLPLFEDLGSGVLYDFKQKGIGSEPTVREAIAQGADLVSFSGDKLLGGPQAGIIAGKKKWIDRLKKHQLARVLRVDKMTLAALEATLAHYRDEEEALTEIPTIRAVLLTQEEVFERIERFQIALDPAWKTDVTESFSQVGGGTMPEVQLPTYVLLLTHPIWSANELQRELRNGSPAVISRIVNEQVALDFRTIEENEQSALHQRLQECIKERSVK